MLQAREQRQGHESVRDGGAKGTRSGPFRVDVDPLVITRCVGEQIDLFLGDGHPVALPDLFARGGGQVGDRLEGAHGSLLWSAVSIGVVRAVVAPLGSQP
ncbi:Uncharacterised protein [Mycobacterium tuberculosis]|nr:Uncharacterised protein [Mycobacterium tuberculosis]